MTRRAGVAGLVALAVLVGSCGTDGERSPAPAPPATSPPPDVVDHRIADLLADALPPGAGGTIVAARDGRLVHCAGFGLADHEARTPATCDTAYDLMSMTKQFTAAAVLKLQMQGRLTVDEPIHRFLDAVPADKRAVTVHHLLTHTAGLVEALGDDYDPLSREQMVTRALGSTLRSEPGAAYHYSNLGYSLLAAVVEEVSGLGYEEFLSQHLFEPAGMTSTGYVGPEWAPGQVAVEYDARGEPRGRPFEHPWAEDGPYWNLRGNGGLISTGRDLFRWHIALEGDDVLDRGAKEQLFEPHVLEEPGGETSYGYGWVVQERRPLGTIVAHDGGNAWSYGQVVRLLDKDVLVFLVTNQARGERAGSNFVRGSSTVVEGVVTRLLAG